MAQVGGVLVFKSGGTVGKTIMYLTGIEEANSGDRWSQAISCVLKVKSSEASAILENAREGIRRQ